MRLPRIVSRSSRVFALVVASLASGTAGAQVKVGPVGPAHPFPLWYEDASAPAPDGLRLEPCLAGAACALVTQPGLGGTTFDPGQPVAFPGNFPSEIFYSSVSADLPLAGVNRGLQLILRVEGTFGFLKNGRFDPDQP